MDIRQLRYFSEVAAAGTYRGASTRLHVTEPGIWKQVRLLERELGVELLEREGRRVHLTASGSLLLTRVDQALASFDRITRLAEDLRAGRAGSVIVGCGPAHIPRFLGPLLRQFRHAHPDVEIELREYPRQENETAPHETSPLDDLLHGRLDLIMFPRISDDVMGIVAFEGHLVAVLPEASACCLSIEALRDEVLLVQQGAHAARTLLEAACRSSGFEPIIKVESRNASTLVALGEFGDGVPVMFDYVAETISRGPGVPIHDARGPIRTTVLLAWEKGRILPPAVETFIAEARAFADAGMAGPTAMR